MSQDIPVFELKNVSQRFGNFTSLNNINLQIYSGENVALVGASGAGKSTLISLFNGSLIPSEGEVWVLGKNITSLRPKLRRKVQARIGTIYQQFHLVNNLQVIHNVNAGHLAKWSFWKALISLIRPLEVETAIKALTKVGIPQKLYETTSKLSGGEQQRVAIARTLVQYPAVILADEPISSLDPERSREIMDLLLDLSTVSGTTLVSSIHAIEFVSTHFQRVIGLRQGNILFDSATEKLSSKMIEELYRI
ncbi:MAG: ATP-binding cassette domain-containing protein [Cyanobacteria bacterium P01_A01_bin.84]